MGILPQQPINLASADKLYIIKLSDMIFRSFNFKLIFRLLILLVLTVFLGIAITKVNVVWIVLLSIFILIAIFELLHQVESVNRKLTYFFDAVRNEDSTLHFSERVQDDSTRHLHESLNHLNKLISFSLIVF